MAVVKLVNSIHGQMITFYQFIQLMSFYIFNPHSLFNSLFNNMTVKDIKKYFESCHQHSSEGRTKTVFQSSTNNSFEYIFHHQDGIE